MEELDIMFSFPTQEQRKMVEKIESNDYSIKDIKNRCKDFAEAFKNVYPAKYKTTRGYVIDNNGDRHEHHWCVNRLTHEIFDPTKEQFNGIKEYHEVSLVTHNYPRGFFDKCQYTYRVLDYVQHTMLETDSEDELEDFLKSQLGTRKL